MDYNFHTHTYYCSHAEKGIEEYIKRAIFGGIKILGFSEHFPLEFSDGTQSFYRLQVEKINEYFCEIRELKEKYKDKIKILIGFEMEYYENLFDQMKKNAISYGADYLILGQHYIIPENIKGSPYMGAKSDDENNLKAYVKSVVKAIKTGAYTYIAHPDIINFTGDNKIFSEEYRKICIASREHNIPLEINFLGIRDKRHYPKRSLLKVAGEEKAPITFGIDAHTIETAYDEKSLEVAESMVKEYNLNYIGCPKIRPLK